jgi:CRP-like cAMP-binding protein
VQAILEAARELPVTTLGPQGILVSEGDRSGRLYILKSGDLEVLRDGSVVAAIAYPGAIVGEISALLAQPHSATVRSRGGAQVHVAADPIGFLDDHPAVARHMAKSLASRLQKTTALLVDLRQRLKARDDHELADKIFALLK